MEIFSTEKTQVFYISLSPNDVLEAIENEPEMSEILSLNLIHIVDLGIYLATY